jgi:flagellar biosynthetic protein FliS
MQGYPNPNATDMYMGQRLQSASPEQLAAILLEGGQRYLTLALDAMSKNDVPSKARCVNRVSDFIGELSLRLNWKDGGEVVNNLNKIYKMWMDELFDAARKNQPARLERIRRQMGNMRVTWEERHRKNTIAQQPLTPRASLDLMVG